MSRVHPQFPHSAPSRIALIVGAGLCLFGGLSCAVGLALTPEGEDVAQLVYLAGTVLATTGLLAMGYLAEIRRRALLGARWRSRQLIRVAQQLSDIDFESPEPDDVHEESSQLKELRSDAQEGLEYAPSDQLLLIDGGFIEEAEALERAVEIIRSKESKWRR